MIIKKIIVIRNMHDVINYFWQSLRRGGYFNFDYKLIVYQEVVNYINYPDVT